MNLHKMLPPQKEEHVTEKSFEDSDELTKASSLNILYYAENTTPKT